MHTGVPNTPVAQTKLCSAVPIVFQRHGPNILGADANDSLVVTYMLQVGLLRVVLSLEEHGPCHSSMLVASPARALSGSASASRILSPKQPSPYTERQRQNQKAFSASEAMAPTAAAHQSSMSKTQNGSKGADVADAAPAGTSGSVEGVNDAETGTVAQGGGGNVGGLSTPGKPPRPPGTFGVALPPTSPNMKHVTHAPAATAAGERFFAMVAGGAMSSALYHSYSQQRLLCCRGRPDKGNRSL